MTIQKRTLIELSDIAAIEFECSHCQARLSIPIANTDRRIGSCPNCRQEWLPRGSSGSPSDEQLVELFIDRLRQLQGRTLGAAIRLQLSPEPDK